MGNKIASGGNTRWYENLSGQILFYTYKQHYNDWLPSVLLVCNNMCQGTSLFLPPKLQKSNYWVYVFSVFCYFAIVPKWNFVLNSQSLPQKHCVCFGKPLATRHCVAEALQKRSNVVRDGWAIWKTYYESHFQKYCIVHRKLVPQVQTVNWISWGRIFTERNWISGPLKFGVLMTAMHPVTRTHLTGEFPALQHGIFSVFY